jgi:hypothetical protein
MLRWFSLSEARWWQRQRKKKEVQEGCVDSKTEEKVLMFL